MSKTIQYSVHFLANTSGFSLHAGVLANADEPDKLETLCRCISRPAISEPGLSMTQHGKVRYELKTPYRDLALGNPPTQANLPKTNRK